MIVRAFEHQEAHGTVERSEEQHRVSHGNVVGHEQRTASRRHALTPGNIKAIERVRKHPQQKPQQRIRQQPQDVNRCAPAT